jgi:hypothetical protein
MPGTSSLATPTDLYGHLEPRLQREASELLAATVEAAREGKKEVAE